jgi:fucose 4-O-acetylase-like acetyltransferase
MLKRNQTVDVIKGVLVVLVVFGHVKTDNNFIALLQEVAYIFHMPLFFVIGVYYIKPDSIKKNFRKSLFLLVVYAFVVLLLKRDIKTTFFSLLASNFRTLNSILWFIPALVTLRSLVFFGLQSIAANWVISIFSVVAILNRESFGCNSVFSFWGLNIAVYLYPIAYSQHKLFRVLNDKVKTEGSKKIRIALLYFILFLLFVCVFYVRVPIQDVYGFSHRLDLAQYNVPEIEGYLYLLIISAMITCLSCTDIRIQIFECVGKVSLVIYLLHLPVINGINKIIPDTIDDLMVLVVVKVGLAVLICTFVAKCCQRIMEMAFRTWSSLKTNLAL